MDNEAISRQFQDKKPTFEDLETEALYIIRDSLGRTDIKLHSIASRIKEVHSFLQKVERIQTNRPFDEIHDIVGLRVICLFLSDIERIGEVIRQSFSVVSEDNKIEGSEVSSFGYMSVHFIVTMKQEYAGPRYDRIVNSPLEIQVRTIAMDAWANVSHYLEYKSETDVPTDLRRDFYALSGLFYVADKHFEIFFQSRKQKREQFAEEFAKPAATIDQEINLDSLTEYLARRFPDRSHAGSDYVSGLIQDLSAAGITLIQQLSYEIDRGYEAFQEYDTEHPPPFQGAEYTDLGVVRIILSITNEKFRNLNPNEVFRKRFSSFQTYLK